MWAESAEDAYLYPLEEQVAPAPVALINAVLFPAVLLALALMVYVMAHPSAVFGASEAKPPAEASAKPSAVSVAKPSVETHPSANQPAAGGYLAPFFTPEVQHWRNQILRWGKEYGLDPNLIATVMQIESCGNPRAVSGAGAMGLFQVMPFHFAYGENPYDPETNARRGLWYLKQALVRSGGNPTLALAGYNGGLGVIGLPQSAWAAETRRYVAWGASIYRDAAAGKKTSQALLNWYRFSGRSLCLQARLQLQKR